MYVATNITNQNKPQVRGIWQAIILVFITISIPLGLIAIKLGLDFRADAGPTEEPVELVHSNLTPSSIVISFETPSMETRAIVSYKTAGGIANSQFDKKSENGDGTESYKLHYHEIKNLDPNTEYTYSIVVGGETYEKEEYKFKTLPLEATVPTPFPVFGKVEGSIFSEGVIYAHLTDGSTNSTVVSSMLPESGAYALELGSAKKADGEPFPSGAQIVVFASVPGLGKGFAVGESGTQSMEEISLDENAAPYNPFSLEYKEGEPLPTAAVTEEPEETPIDDDNTDPIVDPDPTATPIPPTPTPSPTPIPESPLEISNLNNNESLIQGAVLFGIGKPNSLLTIKLGPVTLGSTMVTGDGEWQFAIPQNANTGPNTLTLENEENSLSLDIFVEKLNDLPDTALVDYTPYIPGILITIFGIYLLYWTKKEVPWGTSTNQKRQIIDILN